MALSELSNTTDLSNANALNRRHLLAEDGINSAQNNVCAVSWAAILAGAAAAAALSLILLLLGAGLGLSSVSPWAHKGVSASTFGISTIVWLIVTQILAAGMGGYLAGRLRIRWAGVPSDEVYFRDTAHGFLTWAVATLVTAALLASAIGSIVNGGVQAAATLGSGAALAGVTAASANNQASDETGYFVDTMFRQNATISASTTAPQSSAATSSTEEVTRILTNSMHMKALPAADLTYISQLVATHTGLTQADAEERVNGVYVNMQTKARDAEVAAKEAADKARKASIYTTLWLFVSLLMGAFSASLAATCGGRCRDA